MYEAFLKASLDPYFALIPIYYEQYKELALEQIPELSTQTFVLTILGLCIPPLFALFIFENEAAKLRAAQPKGCRKLGLNIESNLTNEFDKKFSEGFPPSDEETSAEWWRVKSLWIYPIKSCRGVELNRATIVASGMQYDRQFTFAQLRSPSPVAENAPDSEKQPHKWEFITQRQYPLLANVRTEMWAPDQSVEGYAPHLEDVESGGVVNVSFPYSIPGWRGYAARFGAWCQGTYPEKTFRIPFNPTEVQAEKAGYVTEDMTVWKETVSALNLEIEIPEELRYYLGISNKLGLFRVDGGKLREVYRCAPTKEELGWQPVTGFQDAYPLHLINLASVRDVERQMPRVKGQPRLSATRFRANIIITGPPAYTEDSWKKIKIGYYEYAVSCRTARCKLPNVNQTTGVRDLGPLNSRGEGEEPDRTLRRVRQVDGGAKGWGVLGMQMCPIFSGSGHSKLGSWNGAGVNSREGRIMVGDEIKVLEEGEHFYIPQ